MSLDGFSIAYSVFANISVLYHKCDEVYHPEDEGGIVWNDPNINVEWPDVGEIILSEKDKNNPTLAECKMKFEV